MLSNIIVMNMISDMLKINIFKASSYTLYKEIMHDQRIYFLYYVPYTYV